MKKIRTWDKVKVISGSFKWTVSVIERVDWTKVIVKWVNVRKKAVKKQWFIERTLPIDISNVMLYSDSTSWTTKVSIKEENGKKIRVCKKTNKEIK